MKNYNEIFILCQNIKILRERNGLTKNEMAKILAIGINNFSKIEQGIMPPRTGVNIIFRLLQKYNTKPCDLFKPMCE